MWSTNRWGNLPLNCKARWGILLFYIVLLGAGWRIITAYMCKMATWHETLRVSYRRKDSVGMYLLVNHPGCSIHHWMNAQSNSSAQNAQNVRHGRVHRTDHTWLAHPASRNDMMAALSMVTSPKKENRTHPEGNEREDELNATKEPKETFPNKG